MALDEERLPESPRGPEQAAESKAKSRRRKKKGSGGSTGKSTSLPFPRHTPLACLRIPTAVLTNNAGNPCSPKDAAKFAKLNWSGEIGVEISSATKYGFLSRPAPGQVQPTDLVRNYVRPKAASDKINSLRAAVLQAPLIGDVYKYYRGEDLPDREFVANTAADQFQVPIDRTVQFTDVFIGALKDAELLEELPDKRLRVLDVTHAPNTVDPETPDQRLAKVAKGVEVERGETAFVMMPFGAPLGTYYEAIYKPAIQKAGLVPERADSEIFGTGKIIDQIWSGINKSRVLVAELTTRNPNVFYELGLAHALRKPVVLVSANENDVPFDIRHVRVIYYDVSDPFWGSKLIDKIAEKILSALRNPSDAVLFV